MQIQIIWVLMKPADQNHTYFIHTVNLYKNDWSDWIYEVYMSPDIKFPTMWYVQPAKAQISLRICAVWSEHC